MAPVDVKVIVVSDIMCPWCWIGKRHIEVAAKNIGEDLSLQLEWKPFQLDSKLPPEGREKVEYYIQRYGPDAPSWFKNPQGRLSVAGREVGINFQYHEGCIVGNTRNGHKLMAFALQRGGVKLQNHLQEVLFRQYFSEGVNLGDKEVLLTITDEVGIDRSEAERVITTTNEYDKIVDQELAAAAQKGVRGVPHFTFPNGAVISGGSPVANFQKVLEECMK